ncbi:magnesium chelatase [Alkalihalobacillus alcalophilus ATCC 27647 = CGMCC 1.3604]|uniref:ATPase AAA n=1 Tax=Alkalihalobacillus alcalophilus ATCC 27647 = CGMCC 1.3604 TaxID=1218173 RepID=A0A094WD04_ALKAL|nr:MoxR family ATPase [Alkalihalobacillus alcalophilus]KGA95654.1 ATPase AAA [Alkalihalobacillus alcalophilus ATCC 27647 = CGMCC 1.3604]MED1562834.1 MoxR family ATPase [Alkalihalobacillus alcalophilus]THG89338.1 magnesium chelatase [Alkalihalobacillus alcalophilus ATCC 27647 = CGMCC 1.3604]
MTTLHQIEKVINNIEKVVVGKRKEIELCLVALMADGHVLLEDVPGVGKTMLVKSMARSVGAEFKRIQFTPDLLPSDVTGVSIYNQQTQSFTFRPGPIMANIVLADEINRTSPKTQAALLESLEEASITVDGETRVLQKPFFVMATQNPVEYAGTFPLPEAQLDRFLIKLQIGYPSINEELEMLRRIDEGLMIEEIDSVISTEQVLALQKQVGEVLVDVHVKTYIVRLTHATREHRSVELGVSPRGTIALMKAAQAYALIQGRDYVIPDDVQYLAMNVLSHRIILSTDAKMANITVEHIVKDILKRVEVPVARRRLTTS